MSTPDETTPARGNGKSAQKTLVKRNSFGKNTPYQPVIVPVKSNSKDGFSITFVHLGRKYYQMTLWASTLINRRKWVEAIQKQQELMRERSLIFDTVTLSEGFFVNGNRVNCAAPFSMAPLFAYLSCDQWLIYSNFRWRSSGCLWYLRRGLFLESAWTNTGSSQSSRFAWRDSSRCSWGIPTVDSFVRYVYIINSRAIGPPVYNWSSSRTSSFDIPPWRSQRTWSDGRTKAREENIVSYVIFQSGNLFGANTRMCG